jgi:hypothetical protein
MSDTDDAPDFKVSDTDEPDLWVSAAHANVTRPRIANTVTRLNP